MSKLLRRIVSSRPRRVLPLSSVVCFWLLIWDCWLCRLRYNYLSGRANLAFLGMIRFLTLNLRKHQLKRFLQLLGSYFLRILCRGLGLSAHCCWISIVPGIAADGRESWLATRPDHGRLHLGHLSEVSSWSRTLNYNLVFALVLELRLLESGRGTLKLTHRLLILWGFIKALLCVCAWPDIHGCEVLLPKLCASFAS